MVLILLKTKNASSKCSINNQTSYNNGYAAPFGLGLSKISYNPGIIAAIVQELSNEI